MERWDPGQAEFDRRANRAVGRFFLYAVLLGVLIAGACSLDLVSPPDAVQHILP